MSTTRKPGRTSRIPGRISASDRQMIDRAIAGELDERMTRAWFAFVIRRWDEREEAIQARERMS